MTTKNKTCTRDTRSYVGRTEALPATDLFHAALFDVLAHAHPIRVAGRRIKPTKEHRALIAAAIDGFRSTFGQYPSTLTPLYRRSRLFAIEARGAVMGEVWTTADREAA